MRGLQDQVARVVQHGRLGLGRCSPEHIDDRPVLSVHSLQDRVCELFPAVSAMGIGLVGPDCQDGIEKEHALSGPFDQVSVVGHITAQVVVELIEDIDQGRRRRAARADGEAHAVCLPLPVIGILPQNDNSYIGERCLVQGIEEILGGRIDRVGFVLILHKGKEISVILFGKLRPERLQPVAADRCHLTLSFRYLSSSDQAF